MVEALVKLSRKGQLVVPKLLREEFGLLPGREVALRETAEGVLISRPRGDPVAVFRELAMKSRLRRLPKPHAIEEEWAGRLRRAGLRR